MLLRWGRGAGWQAPTCLPAQGNGRRQALAHTRRLPPMSPPPPPPPLPLAREIWRLGRVTAWARVTEASRRARTRPAVLHKRSRGGGGAVCWHGGARALAMTPPPLVLLTGRRPASTSRKALQARATRKKRDRRRRARRRIRRARRSGAVRRALMLRQPPPPQAGLGCHSLARIREAIQEACAAGGAGVCSPHPLQAPLTPPARAGSARGGRQQAWRPERAVRKVKCQVEEARGRRRMEARRRRTGT
jgi:hypothetical protein